MPHLLVRHKVADFAAWKTAYDADGINRKNAGLTETQLSRSVSNPNEVLLLFSASDLKKAQDFASSPQLRETMQKAGVIDKPDVSFWQ